MIVEWATEDYIDQILDLHTHTFDQHKINFPREFHQTKETNLNTLKFIFDNSLKNGEFKNSILICKQDEILLGYLIISSGFDATEGSTISILDICTTEESRGTGVATKLINSLLEFANQNCVRQINAQTWHGNIASEKLFDRQYFKPTFTNHSYYLDCTRENSVLGGFGKPKESNSSQDKQFYIVSIAVILGIVILSFIGT